MRSTYSNEDFDVMQHIASKLTAFDRRTGRDATRYGYSEQRAADARCIVDTARTADEAVDMARALTATPPCPHTMPHVPIAHSVGRGFCTGCLETQPAR